MFVPKTCLNFHREYLRRQIAHSQTRTRTANAERIPPMTFKTRGSKRKPTTESLICWRFMRLMRI